jgi:hypothetical protein
VALLRAKIASTKFAGKGSRAKFAKVRVPYYLRAKVRVPMSAGKASSRVRVRAKLAGKALLKPAVVKQPIARCITPYFCSVCKPDYSMALAMGLHERLGEASPVALTDDLLRTIIEMTKPRRQLPAWMSCSWDVNRAKRRQARAVLERSRASQRRREAHGDSTSQPDGTAEAV